MHAFRHAPNGLAHRCHDFPIHDVVHELSLHRSNALADDRYAVLHRDRCDGHLCVNELDRHDAAHRFADALDDHQNCVDDHHHDVDDLDGRHHDADVPDGRSQNYEDDLDGRRRGADGKVVNRHDEGLWLQRHLGELDGLNHYLVLGDADRFCLV